MLFEVKWHEQGSVYAMDAAIEEWPIVLGVLETFHYNPKKLFALVTIGLVLYITHQRWAEPMEP